MPVLTLLSMSSVVVWPRSYCSLCLTDKWAFDLIPKCNWINWIAKKIYDMLTLWGTFAPWGLLNRLLSGARVQPWEDHLVDEAPAASAANVLNWEEGIAKVMWPSANSKIESDKYKNGWWTSVPSSRLEVVHYSSVGHRQQFRGCRLARSAGTVMRSKCWLSRCDRSLSTSDIFVMPKNWHAGRHLWSERPQLWSKHLPSCKM